MFFKQGNWYENRQRKFQVIELSSGKMVIRYENGMRCTINNLQLHERIVRNIQDERYAVHVTCLCNWGDAEILRHIQGESLPSYALLNNCCWRRVCQVRGRNFSDVDDETWIDICTRRGYLLERQNPRGF